MWEQRPDGCNDWETLDELATRYASDTATLNRLSAEGAKRIAAIKIAKEQAPPAFIDFPINEAKQLYLDNMEKRVGLIGSLGMSKPTFVLNSYRLNRLAWSFCPNRLPIFHI